VHVLGPWLPRPAGFGGTANGLTRACPNVRRSQGLFEAKRFSLLQVSIWTWKPVGNEGKVRRPAEEGHIDIQCSCVRRHQTKVDGLHGTPETCRLNHRHRKILANLELPVLKPLVALRRHSNVVSAGGRDPKEGTIQGKRQPRLRFRVWSLGFGV